MSTFTARVGSKRVYFYCKGGLKTCILSLQGWAQSVYTVTARMGSERVYFYCQDGIKTCLLLLPGWAQNVYTVTARIGSKRSYCYSQSGLKTVILSLPELAQNGHTVTARVVSKRLDDCCMCATIILRFRGVPEDLWRSYCCLLSVCRICWWFDGQTNVSY